MDDIFQLVNNPIEVFEETSRVLLKIADNVLKSPNNPKVRMLQKTNETIKKKILSVDGGKACLKAMGFQEEALCFNLPVTDSLSNLKQMRFELSRLRNGEKSDAPEQCNVNIPNSDNEKEKTMAVQPSQKTETNPVQNVKVQVNGSSSDGCGFEDFKQITLPPYTSIFANPFLKEIETLFHQALYFDNAYLQERALSIIPSKELEENAQIALRTLQVRIKKEKLKDPEVNLQDFLILELLAWFKNDFFEWVDNPPCTACNGKTKFSHRSTDKEQMKYTDRVEIHKCITCNTLTPFPRYNDLNILLETRKGRCGEWANTFTLMCRAMGWDARFVMDQTDHVWTEVYSFSQRKWLHCDPCENACDTPLMYESGWKKTISYVMAFSGEEIQDVTWRYSSRHKEVLKRRTKCIEAELVQAMAVLRENRQSTLSPSRQDYLNKRFLSELVELMVEKQPTDDVKQGRTSGALDWRLTRGETEGSKAMFIWHFGASEVSQGNVCVQYSSALNQYQKVSSDGTTTINNWDAGLYETEGIFRKVETDWKQAYLCRTESAPTGHISWRFKVDDPSYSIETIEYLLERTTFENGCVTAKICSDAQCVLVTSDKGKTNAFAGINEVTVTTKFTDGKGDNAWQHAQLCREDLDANSFSLKFVFTFRKNS